MSYKGRRKRQRKGLEMRKEGERVATEALIDLRHDRGLRSDEAIPDAALKAEVLGYFHPSSPHLIRSYLAERLDGKANSEAERDELVGSLLRSPHPDRKRRLSESEPAAMKARANDLRSRPLRSSRSFRGLP